jgi:hypothetical protein
MLVYLSPADYRITYWLCVEHDRTAVQVQAELYKNLQNQHTLLQQHYMSQAFQQQQQLFSHYLMQVRMHDFHPRLQ